MNENKRVRTKAALARHMVQLDKYNHVRNNVALTGDKKELSLGKDKINKLKTCIENTKKNLDNSIWSMR